jgi:hypothetical protein
MISRFVAMKSFIALVLASLLLPAAAWADGPRYTYVGASYEWTDSKFGVDPSDDANFNDGSIAGVSIEGSLGILSWLHIAGEYFTGDCVDCASTGAGGTSDVDFDGYQAGIGFNYAINDKVDIILRGYYVDVDLSDIIGDGWASEVEFRSQFSDRVELQAGFAYQDLDTVQNSDFNVGLLYQVWDGVSLTARGTVAASDVGFDLGVRWYFGDLLFGDRDSIVR